MTSIGGNMDGALTELAQQKAQLEVDKLNAEITNLNKRWWKPAAIQIIPNTLLVFLTVGIALFTGVIDAKRDRLAAERDRIAVEKNDLETIKDETINQIAGLKTELADTQNELAEFKSDKVAVDEILKSLPFSVVQRVADYEGYFVTLRPTFFDLFGTGTKSVKSEELLPALKSVKKLRAIAILELRGLRLEDAEAAELETIPVERLALTDSTIVPSLLQHLANNKKLKFLHIDERRVGDTDVTTLRATRPDLKIEISNSRLD